MSNETLPSRRSGESTRLPLKWHAFNSWTRVKFVVGSRPCSERFFSRYSSVSLSSKSTTSKFQFDLGWKGVSNCNVCSELTIYIDT